MSTNKQQANGAEMTGRAAATIANANLPGPVDLHPPLSNEDRVKAVSELDELLREYEGKYLSDAADLISSEVRVLDDLVRRVVDR